MDDSESVTQNGGRDITPKIAGSSAADQMPFFIAPSIEIESPNI